MRFRIKALIALGALLAAIVPAAPQSQTLPPNTVLGRTGITPGPAQAIPFATFGSLLVTGGFIQLPTIIPATDFYVSATGNDGADCQSAAVSGGHGPCLTTQRGINAIVDFDLNGTFPTLHIGAGTFVGFNVLGPIRGCIHPGGSDTCFTVSGAGSGSTTLTSSLGGTTPAVGLSGTAAIGISAMNLSVAANGNGINANTGAVLSVGPDISITGAASTSNPIFADAFGFVAQTGAIAVKGTIGTFFVGTSDADFENTGGFTITFTGTVGTFANLDILSNMHGAIAAFSGGGNANDFAYIVSGNSVINSSGLGATWLAAGGISGVAQTGGRSENGTATATTVVGTTGLGTGATTSLTPGSTGYLTLITLTTAGAPSSSGTVTLQLGEFLSQIAGTAPYVVGLQDGTGGWNNAATTRMGISGGSGLGQQITITWANGGAALTTAKTYIVTLMGQT